jgi:hypothetical protein
MFERDCRPGLTNLFVLVGRSEPRDPTLGHTWFYSGPKATTAEVGLVVVQVGGWGSRGLKYCCNWFRSNFSLPHQFVIHSPVWFSSGQ